MNFYVWQDNKQSGPYTLAQLRSMWAAGSVTASALICAEGKEEWQPAAGLLDAVLVRVTKPSARPTPRPAAVQEVPAKKSSGCAVAAAIGLALCALFLVIPAISNAINGPSSPSTSVRNSAYDGSVSQVSRWIRDNAKDPESVDFIEWSPVAKQGSGSMVRVKYRAANSFGGMVIEEKIFVMDGAGNVVSAVGK